MRNTFKSLALLTAFLILAPAAGGASPFPVDFSARPGRASHSHSPSPSPTSEEQLAPHQMLGLAQAVNLALKNNFLLKAAREKVTQAEARFNQAQSAKNFKAKIEGSSVVQGPEILIPMMGAEFVVRTKYNTAGRLAVENLLSSFGKVENQISAAFFQAQAQDDEYRAQQSDLVLETQKTYFNILRSAQALSVAEEYRQLAGEYLDLAEKQHRLGVVSNYDVLRAEVSVEEAGKNQISARKALDLSKSALLCLLGETREIPFEVQSQPPQIPQADLDLGQLQKNALENRFELKTMNHNLNSARAMLKAASSLNNPNLVLLGEYDCQTMQISFIPKYNWNAGFGLSLPLLDGGERTAKVKEAQAAVRQLENAKSGLEQQIKLEVTDAWLTVRENTELVKVQLRETEKNREGYRLAKARYQEGVSLAVEMDESLLSYHNSRKNLVDSAYQLNLACSALEKAVGSAIPRQPFILPGLSPDETPQEEVK